MMRDDALNTINLRFDGLERRLARVKTQLRDAIAQQRETLCGEMAVLAETLRGEMAMLRRDLGAQMARHTYDDFATRFDVFVE